ncbi:zinc finger protein 624-like [Ambystoma mexicanum]|uniref:zinc finger protein 624-like n=1 Tax=Ambystoma mexicanum TaxID=8296 RepID=UPI0037E7A021
MLARSRFYQRRQSPGELFGEFAAELKLLAQDCGFSNPVEMVRDRLVCGVYRRELRARLVSEGAQLSLGRALEIASTFETETVVGSDFPSHHWMWARPEVQPSISPEEREEGVLSPTQPDEHPYLKIIPMSFEDVSFHFTKQQWEILQPFQKQLYKDVMVENYKTLMSLGSDISKPELLSRLEEDKGLSGGPPEENRVFMPVVDEPVMASSAISSQKLVTENSTVGVQEMRIMNGRQWNGTVKSISANSDGPGQKRSFMDLAAHRGVPNQCFGQQSGSEPLEASPTLCLQMLAPDLNLQSGTVGTRELHNAYTTVTTNEQPGCEPMLNQNTDCIQQLQILNIPSHLNVKQEEVLDYALAIHYHPKTSISLLFDAIPRSDDSSKVGSGIDLHPLCIETGTHATQLEMSGHSDTESPRRHSTCIKEKQPETPPAKADMEGLSHLLVPSSSTKAAPASRMRESSSEEAQATNQGHSKRGPKPRNQNVKRPAHKPSLAKQQVPLAVQKMYRCSKFLRTFSHYFQCIARHRYQMTKKAAKRPETSKMAKKQLCTTASKKCEAYVAGDKELVHASGKTFINQRVSRPGRNPEDSKKKENHSRSPQHVGLRLRERKKTYTCNVCKEGFTSKSSIVVRKGTSNEDVYICRKCEKADCRRTTPVVTKYECDICKKQCVQRAALFSHMRTHTGIKPHQ